MSSSYQPHEFEKKWQDEWERQGTYQAKDEGSAEKDQKFYGLIEFPYPSGEGLHVGHPRSFTAIDIVTRKKRMEGKNVLYPIGWDAFGLPTENFAIKNKIKPVDATATNVANFKRQIQSLGLGFDWSREVNTTDPAYYKWTQWMFLKFFTSYYDEVAGRAQPIEELAIPDQIKSQGKAAVRTYIDAHRMAYKAKSTINWCPRCKIGLANEEAQGGVCERCGNPVEQRVKAQWMIRITKYADRLIADLDTVDYLEKIRAQQIHWIGKSQGAEIRFALVVPGQPENKHSIAVFTTRPETLFSAAFVVISPEAAKRWMDVGWQATEDVRRYVEGALLKSDQERVFDIAREKTGVNTGVEAINPVNQERISVWVADYVLGSYGTGAIFADAHDLRDFDMAKKFDIPLRVSVRPPDDAQWERVQRLEECYEGEGIMVNSGVFDGLSTQVAKEKIIDWLEELGTGKRTTTYRLRDWVFSRQRYWGEPIPIVICKSCGFVPVSEDQLPLILPEVENYEPTDTGESPLASVRSWVEVSCPVCGESAERETDTMPNWAGSSWYFLRYCDPHNDQAFADREKLKYWLPIDLYNGGMEHTTLHLLYSRFWYKFLWDLDVVPRECGNEPYQRRRSHALILGEGGVKMSKSKGNVVNPDEVVEKYGADVFRLYEMFMGPYDQDAPWDTQSIEGVKRFLEKVWRLFSTPLSTIYHLPSATETLLHQTIKKVGEDIESLRFNTAISAMMILVNEMGKESSLSQSAAESVLKLLAPFAPHFAEELWYTVLNKSSSIHLEPWPVYDVSKIVASTFELVIQVDGKVRDRMTVDADITETHAKDLALRSEKVQSYLGAKVPVSIIYVPGRLVSISTQ